LLEHIKDGDTIVVTELSRLARNMSSLVQLSTRFKERNIRLISLKENIDTSSPLVGPLRFNIMAAFYEFEREIIRERTKQALESKRKRGVMGGRPRIPSIKINRALQEYDKQEMSISEILSTYNLCASTFYHYLRKRKKGFKF